MKSIFLIVALLSGITELFAQTTGHVATYRNPVISGDGPDPTVIRVGDTYFSAGTSADFGPNYPLYESTDLVNWKRIGSVFNHPPAWTSWNFWAPELFYNNGIYYAYYVAKRKTDNVACIGVATATDIHQEFTDHGILIEWGKEAIDPFVFKDSDGKLYITWKAYGLDRDRPIEILGSELSPDGLSLVGESFSLTRHDLGWVGGGDEGQCLIKRNDYYYLFYSVGGCCGAKCSYRVHVARSKNLKAGWEQYAFNPILESGELWKCSGHGTIVETPDHRFFYLYHAYHGYDFQYVGRQGMLDELLWDESTGWPYFKYGKNPSAQAEMPFKNTTQQRDAVFHDDFSSAANAMFWQWDLKGIKPGIIRTNELLTLTNAEKGLAFLGISPKTGNYQIETGVLRKGTNSTGLCIYGSKENLLGFGTADKKLVLFEVRKGVRHILSESPLPDSASIFLKGETRYGRLFRFSWSTNQKDWKLCATHKGDPELNGSFLPTWDSAMRAGLFVENGDKNSGQFSFFNITNEY